MAILTPSLQVIRGATIHRARELPVPGDITVKVGDKVLFSKYGYDEVKIENKEYFIVSEQSILGIFTS